MWGYPTAFILCILHSYTRQFSNRYFCFTTFGNGLDSNIPDTYRCQCQPRFTAHSYRYTNT